MSKKTRLQHADRVVELPDHVSDRYQAIVQKAYNGTASPMKAIKAKCVECVNYESPATTIHDCTVERCPLWLYRPYQRGAVEE